LKFEQIIDKNIVLKLNKLIIKFGLFDNKFEIEIMKLGIKNS
jgi:hypothetical protein